MTVTKRPITVEDLLRIIDIEDPQVSPDERWIAYIQRSLHRIENEYRTNIWLASTDGTKLLQLTRSGKDSQPRWSPDGKQIAFTSGRAGKPQIYLLPVEAPGGEAFALTSLINGAHSPAWSPDGKQIAFLSASTAEERATEANPTTAPTSKLEARQIQEQRDHDEAERFDPRIAERIPYRDGYGQRYMDGRFQQIYVIDAVADAVAGAVAGAKPRRLTSIEGNYGTPEWTPDSAALITFRPSQVDADEPSRLDNLYRISVTDGAEQPLNDEPYANRNGIVSPDGQQIVYVRVPQEKLYTRLTYLAIMPVEGGTGQDLSLSLDRSVVDARWAADSKSVYFRLQADGNTEVYAVKLSDGSISPVIAAGENSFIEVQSFNVSKNNRIAYVASTPQRPGELFWRSASGETRQLTNTNDALLDELIVPVTHEIRYPASDGSTVQGWYILPVDYQEGTRSPLIAHVHGGPRVMANPASKMWHEWQLYAANGFVLFFCNAHGSDGYGQEYQRVSYGDIDFPDHMAGIDLLVERGIADADRLALTGGSYGGYMTAWIVSHTERFKVALAERGLYNLLSHYGTTDFPTPTPQEFDAEPWEAPMLLWEKSPLAHAHKITTPLMILHSENDFRVLISEAEQLFGYMRMSGRIVKLVRFPREGHNLSRTGEPVHRVKRLNIMLDWFKQYIFPE